jgi:hypothetical protein
LPSTCNLEFADWTGIFNDDARPVAALLDRLTHRCHLLEFRGESYRIRQSLTARAREGELLSNRPWPRSSGWEARPWSRRRKFRAASRSPSSATPRATRGAFSRTRHRLRRLGPPQPQSRQIRDVRRQSCVCAASRGCIRRPWEATSERIREEAAAVEVVVHDEAERRAAGAQAGALPGAERVEPGYRQDATGREVSEQACRHACNRAARPDEDSQRHEPGRGQSSR